MYDISIIGAGIIGSYIARELSRYTGKILVIDKENDVANGTTKANTALVHAGYDAKEGSLMARFNVEGNKMFDQVCQELYVPFERIGSLVVGTCEDDEKTIRELYERGLKNGVPDMEILNREEILKIEPHIADDVNWALYAKTAGIVGPWELATALMENAMDNGAQLKLNTEVLDIVKEETGYRIKTNQGEFSSRLVINAAGLYADKISRMVSDTSFEIRPVKGEYFLMDKSMASLANSIIFQCPSPTSKGVVVAPTVHGNLIIGPDSVQVEDKDYKGTTGAGLDFVSSRAANSVKGIDFSKNITNFTGLRADPSTGDFIVEEAADAKGFINVAGIKSPGLSSAPAIGVYVAEMARDILELEEKEDFNPRIRRPYRFIELSQEEKKELVKKDKRYGHIICRCENITEGEIVDAIHRNAGATTVDGVKRRVRAGMGRCQGGFCLPRVIEILARELDKDMTQVVKDGPESYILTDKTK